MNPIPETPFQFTIMLHDTDAAGVMFYAQLFRHAHDAYETWLAQHDWSLAALIAHGQWALPIIKATARYHAPMRHGERIAVHFTLMRCGHSSFTLHYAFLNSTGQCAATATTVHVCIEQPHGMTHSLPAELVTRLNTLPITPAHIVSAR